MKNALLILSLLALAGQQWALSWYQGETATLRAEKSALRVEADILRAGIPPQTHDHTYMLVKHAPSGSLILIVDDTPGPRFDGVCRPEMKL